ncbi:hypothetical protein A3J34_04315 [Candidatus Peribacteria bacterium RIFCSPLOWO2_02_FULL_51_10]|nr:MAG: hypothetical protein A3J34_04315 [Candidatus Peribacteria bacterium RIFCSPLOWO2_02_FULL_51_10]
MKVLFIDLAGSEKKFALVSEERTVAQTAVDDHTEERLVEILKVLLEKQKMRFDDLTHILAVTGPGGFMSLRVGISLANALSWALKIPIAGVHSSDLWFYRTEAAIGNWQLANSQKLIANSYLWLHSTKKNLLFIRGFGELSKEWPDPTLISIDELVAKSQKLIANCYLGELIEEHKKILKTFKPLKPLLPVVDILPSLLKNCIWQKKTLAPWYGRGG